MCSTWLSVMPSVGACNALSSSYLLSESMELLNFRVAFQKSANLEAARLQLQCLLRLQSCVAFVALVRFYSYFLQSFLLHLISESDIAQLQPQWGGCPKLHRCRACFMFRFLMHLSRSCRPVSVFSWCRQKSSSGAPISFQYGEHFALQSCLASSNRVGEFRLFSAISAHKLGILHEATKLNILGDEFQYLNIDLTCSIPIACM